MGNHIQFFCLCVCSLSLAVKLNFDMLKEALIPHTRNHGETGTSGGSWDRLGTAVDGNYTNE